MLVLCALFVGANRAEANDYLEKSKHYSIYANGVNYQVPSGDWTGKMYVTQKDDDDCPQVTMLEFDWYIPVSLAAISYPRIYRR